jgi:hypothetical protein
MFSVPSVIKGFGNSKDKTLRELWVKRSSVRTPLIVFMNDPG